MKLLPFFCFFLLELLIALYLLDLNNANPDKATKRVWLRIQSAKEYVLQARPKTNIIEIDIRKLYGNERSYILLHDLRTSPKRMKHSIVATPMTFRSDQPGYRTGVAIFGSIEIYRTHYKITHTELNLRFSYFYFNWSDNT